MSCLSLFTSGHTNQATTCFDSRSATTQLLGELASLRLLGIGSVSLCSLEHAGRGRLRMRAYATECLFFRVAPTSLY